MIVSRLNPVLRSLSLVAGLVLTPAFSFSALAQEADTDENDPVSTLEAEAVESAQASTKDETQPEQPVKRPDIKRPEIRRSFYVGPNLRMQRQIGPSQSAPLSITPKALVPMGSVPLPDIRTQEDTGDVPLQDGATLPDTMGTDSVPADAGISDPLPTDTDTPSSQEDAFETSELSNPDASGIGVLDTAHSYPSDFFKDMTRQQIEHTYRFLGQSSQSPTLRKITQKLLLSGMDVPYSDDPLYIASFLGARLDALAALGDLAGYQALLAAIPADVDTSLLVKEITDSHLLAGRLADACGIASTERLRDPDTYWVRLSVFCAAADGNRSGADFQLGILEELIEVEPVFYQLIDKIVYEAQYGEDGAGPETYYLESALDVTPLHGAMARLAQVQIPILNLEKVTPIAVPLFLSLPVLEADASAALMDYAVRRALVSQADVLQYLAGVEFEEEDVDPSIYEPQEAAADTAEGADDVEDAEGATVLAEQPAFSPLALLKDMKDFLDAGAGGAASPQDLWAQIDASGGAVHYGAVLYRGLTDAQPGAADAAVWARSAWLAGDFERAVALQNQFRASTQSVDEAVDAALKGFYPYIALVEGDLRFYENGGFAKWLETIAFDEVKRARVGDPGALLMLLEAFGKPVAEHDWDTLKVYSHFVATTHPSVPVVYTRALEAAIETGDKAALLMAAANMLSVTGLERLPAGATHMLFSALGTAGFEAEASQLAIEWLIAQGY